jgi:hypothetical protein
MEINNLVTKKCELVTWVVLYTANHFVAEFHETHFFFGTTLILYFNCLKTKNIVFHQNTTTNHTVTSYELYELNHQYHGNLESFNLFKVFASLSQQKPNYPINSIEKWKLQQISSKTTISIPNNLHQYHFSKQSPSIP